MQKLLKSPDTVKYLVAAILLAIPLYPKFPFIKVFGTFVSIRLEDFLLVAAASILAIYVLANFRKFIKNKINRAIFLFLLVGFISLVSALLITKTVVPHIGFLHWLRRIEYFIPFFLGTLAIRLKRSNLEFFLKVLMITMLLVFIYGLGQRYLTWPIIITQNLEYSKGVALRWIPGSHINSTFAGHYDLASFLVLLLPIYVGLLFLVKGLRTRVAIIIILISGLWLLSYSGSRISVVSYLLATTLSLLLIKKYKAILLVIILSLAFFSMSTNLIARYGRIFEVGQQRLQEINKLFFNPVKDGIVYAAEEVTIFKRRKAPTPTPTPVPVFEDRSTSIRLNVEWPRAIRALSKNPLLGTGYSSITLATDNDYLRLLGEVGILGFFAFFLIFLNIGKRAISSFPLTKNFRRIELAYLAGFVGAVPGIFLNAVFIDIFEASKFAIIFWLLTGFTIGLLRNEENN